jgi:hypothetical protein
MGAYSFPVVRSSVRSYVRFHFVNATHMRSLYSVRVAGQCPFDTVNYCFWFVCFLIFI